MLKLCKAESLSKGYEEQKFRLFQHHNIGGYIIPENQQFVKKMVVINFYIKAWCYIYLMSSVHSARILGIFPIEGRSHIHFHEAIMRCLLSVGHQVTLIVPFQLQNSHENLTVMDSRTIQNTRLKPLSAVADPSLSWFATYKIFMDRMELYCHQVLSIYHAKALKNFDVIFVETLPLYQCFLPIAEQLNIPVIVTNSARSMIDSDLSVGMSRPPSVFPNDDDLVPRYRNAQMTFYQKLTNFMQEIQIKLSTILGETIAKRFNENYFPESEWDRVKVSLLFCNDHEIFLPRAKPPNFINIGGIYVKSSQLKPLPRDLHTFIEEASQGVILFSLGSVVPDSLVSSYLKPILKNTFAKIPQRVIWKSKEKVEGLPENVLLSNWVPQKEVLAHKNVLAFISHTGIGSTYESIYFGKPMIFIPLFGDQPSTAAFLSSREVGLYIDFREITEDMLLDAINEVINDTKYRQNMEALSFKFKNDVKSPAELIVYWTDYVLRHKGGSHLRTIEVDIPFYQYFLLDVISFIFLVTLISGYLLLVCVKFLKNLVIQKMDEKQLKRIRSFVSEKCFSLTK